MAACEHNRRLNAYHDGELPREECIFLEEHLRQCPSCARELEQLRRLSGLFTAAEMPEMPSHALGRVHGGVRSVREVSMLRLAQRLMTAAATLLVLCAVLFWQTAGFQIPRTEAPERWEIAAVSPQAEARAEVSDEELLGQWIVWDLARENGSD